MSLAKFPTYLEGKNVLEACGCRICGMRNEFVEYDGISFASLLQDGSLHGTLIWGDEGPEIRRVQEEVMAKIGSYSGNGTSPAGAEK